MRRLTVAGMASLTFVSSSAPFAGPAPAITRIETVGYTNLQGPVSTPYLRPGVSKEYWIIGPWLDYTNYVRINNVNQTILSKGVKNGIAQVHVRLSVPSTTARGFKALQVHIECGPLGVTGFGFQASDCRTGWLPNRNLMVLQMGTLSTVIPNANVIMNQLDTFVVNGSGLSNAGVITGRSMVTSVNVLERTQGRFTFSARPSTCGLAVIMVGDRAEGGAFYPYGTVNVRTTAQCAYQPVPKVSSGGSCPIGMVWNDATQTCQ